MPRTFLRELKRRRVYRVAAAYLIVAWLLIQVATQVFPFFHIPEWSVRLLVLLLLAGFPLAMVLAWAFDAAPHGVERTLREGQPVLRRARRGTAAVGVIAALIAVLAGVAYWHWHRAPAAAPHAAVAPTGAGTAKPAPVAAIGTNTPIAAIPEQSIAVLPLSNESDDKDQQYFSDGLSQDLIDALSQFAGLKVISRNSSFQFRDSKEDSATIARKLGVAHLLEGTVQRAGDEVRISATLVNAVDGSTLWSQHYDRPYKDLFALQDDITKAVAEALKARLLDSGGAVMQSERPPSGSLDAWNAYSRGNFHMDAFTEKDFHAAIDDFNQAVAFDPRYARAYAGMADGWMYLGAVSLGGKEQRQAYARARVAADQSLQLDPELAAGHIARGLLLQWADLDWSGAEAEFRRALQLAPNDGDAKFRLGSMYSVLGHPQQAIDLIRQAVATDPRTRTAYYWLAWNLAAAGELDEAGQMLRKQIELAPTASNVRTGLAILLIQRGDAQSALTAAQQEPPGPVRDFGMALALQAVGDRAAADAALKRLIDKDADAMTYQIAEVYALRNDPDNAFRWLDRAWTNRDPGIQRLLSDPFLLRYRNDPRFAAFCAKVGLPATTEAATAQ